MAKEKSRVLPGERGLSYAERLAEINRDKLKAALELQHLKNLESTAAREDKEKSDQLQREADWKRTAALTNSAYALQQLKQKAKPKTTRVTEEEVDAKGNATGRTITRDVPADQFERDEYDRKLRIASPEIEELKADKALMEKKILEGDEHYGLFNMWSRPNRIKGIDARLSEITPTPPRDLLEASPAELTPVAEEPPQTRIPNAFSGTTSLTGPGWKPPTPTGIIGTPERNMFTAETDLPQNMNREQLNAWAIANNTPSRSAYDLLGPAEFRPTLGDLRQSEMNDVVGPFAGPSAPVAAPKDLLSAPATAGAPMTDLVPEPQNATPTIAQPVSPSKYRRPNGIVTQSDVDAAKLKVNSIREAMDMRRSQGDPLPLKSETEAMESALGEYESAFNKFKTEGKISVTAPDGVPGYIPRKQLDAALAKGYKLAK